MQRATGLSWATVSGSVTELAEHGLITEKLAGSPQKTGRPAKAYDVNPKKNIYIGVDLNVENLQIVAIDMKCRVLHSISRMLNVLDLDAVLALAEASIAEVLALLGEDRAEALGIGLALQGAVDSSRGVALYSHFIKNWRDLDIQKIFEDTFHLPVIIQHDPNCLANAELNIGVGKSRKNMIFVRLSHGIGMAAVLNGEIYNGVTGVFGEIGHVCVDRRGPRCSCGHRGCVEAYASIFGIAARYLETLYPGGGFDSSQINAGMANEIVHKLARAAQAGDGTARAYFDTAADVLGLSIGNVLNLLGPELVILSGVFMEYAGLFYDRLVAVAEEVQFGYAKTDFYISGLKPNAAAIGAAAMFIPRRLEGNLLP
jgi:predicted NBD/HSP70 family sugar kinase